jgi:hypothetical protein
VWCSYASLPKGIQVEIMSNARGLEKHLSTSAAPSHTEAISLTPLPPVKVSVSVSVSVSLSFVVLCSFVLVVSLTYGSHSPEKFSEHQMLNLIKTGRLNRKMHQLVR